MHARRELDLAQFEDPVKLVRDGFTFAEAHRLRLDDGQAIGACGTLVQITLWFLLQPQPAGKLGTAKSLLIPLGVAALLGSHRPFGSRQNQV